MVVGIWEQWDLKGGYVWGSTTSIVVDSRRRSRNVATVSQVHVTL